MLIHVNMNSLFLHIMSILSIELIILVINGNESINLSKLIDQKKEKIKSSKIINY
jgi:hypothetical protein